MNSAPLHFLIDAGVGRHVESYLREQGYDVKSVFAIDPGMPDSEIIHLAALEGRIVVTMDKDFGELVYRLAKKHCGVLLLRLEDATGPEKAAVVANIMKDHSHRLQSHFSVFQRGKLRIRNK